MIRPMLNNQTLYASLVEIATDIDRNLPPGQVASVSVLTPATVFEVEFRRVRESRLHEPDIDDSPKAPTVELPVVESAGIPAGHAMIISVTKGRDGQPKLNAVVCRNLQLPLSEAGEGKS